MGSIWTFIKKIIVVTGILLSGVALLELFRIFVFFYRIRPVCGYSFLAIILISLICIIIYFFKEYMRLPTVLKAPELPTNASDATDRQLKRYVHYLRKYLLRLSTNPALGDTHHTQLITGLHRLDDAIAGRYRRDAFIHLIQTTESETLVPALEALQTIARKEVRSCVRDVMLAVMISPFHSMDLLVVLYRNGAMILKTAKIYHSKPAAFEQWLILRDTIRLVVTINFIHLSRNIVERMFSQVPMVGRVVDEVSQGLGAGLMTSVTGHAAIDRCQAFRGWNKQEAAASLSAHSKTFLADVRQIFTKDIMPEMKVRFKAQTEDDETVQENFWQQVSQGVTGTIDAVGDSFDRFIISPTAAGASTILDAGKAVSRVFAGSPKEDADMEQRTDRAAVQDPAHSSHRSSSHQEHHHRRNKRRSYKPKRKSLIGSLRTFKQRLKYTVFNSPY